MTHPGLLNPEKRGGDVDQSTRTLPPVENAAVSALIRQGLKELAK